MRFLRLILSVVCVVAAVVLSSYDAHAQVDAAALARAQREQQMYGNQNGTGYDMYGNPIAGEEGEEGEQPDSTDVKKKRPKRPNESYYFSDTVRALPNWKWSIDPDFNRVNIAPLDTTLSDWRIDYVFYRKGVGDMALGGLGQSTQPVNWFDRRQDADFSFARSYDAYTARLDNVPDRKSVV